MIEKMGLKGIFTLGSLFSDRLLPSRADLQIKMKRNLLLLTFIAFAVILILGVVHYSGWLASSSSGARISDFSLPLIEKPEQRLTRADVLGSVVLLNVWATWCVPCRREHGVLKRIADTGVVPIYGLNYKDKRKDALRWLRQLGDPYRASALDADGRVGEALGVKAVPETYLLDKDGKIAYQHRGPLTPEVWQHSLLPRIRAIQGHIE